MKTEGQRVGVLLGGLSSEREVSLQTGAGVLAALVERGYDAVAVDWKQGTALPTLLSEQGIEVVWIALHGTYGEDGAVQGLLECLKIPYTGSGILASSLAMDKIFSKRVFESSSIPTPRWRLASETTTLDNSWSYPVVVKPAREGSSVGVSIVKRESELAGALAVAAACEGPTLIEAFVAGAEIAVGILDDAVIGSVEIRPATEFYDYEAKYVRDDTQYLLPPEIAPQLLAQAEAIALDAHRAIGCHGYSRVDLIVEPGGAIHAIEVNTLPGMTSHSLLPKVAAAAGIDYATLCERILASAHLESQ